MFPGKTNLTDTQDNDSKKAVIHMFKELSEDINQCLNKDLEDTNRQWNEIRKSI